MGRCPRRCLRGGGPPEGLLRGLAEGVARSCSPDGALRAGRAHQRQRRPGRALRGRLRSAQGRAEGPPHRRQAA
eukprot:6636147-Lingulodinium_polyedra.AAC.1